MDNQGSENAKLEELLHSQGRQLFQFFVLFLEKGVYSERKGQNLFPFHGQYLFYWYISITRDSKHGERHKSFLPSVKGVYSKRKDFAPIEPIPFSEGTGSTSKKVSPCKNSEVNLSCVSHPLSQQKLRLPYAFVQSYD